LWTVGTPIIKGRSGESVEYTLAPATPVHRLFAALPDSPDELVKFANEFGLLTSPIAVAAVQELNVAKARLRELLAAVDRANTSRGTAKFSRMMELTRLWDDFAAPRLTAHPRLGMAIVPERTATGDATVALRVSPATLYDYMLLLTASELQQGRITWRLCLVCGKPMPIGPRQGRKHQQTCSPACRQRKYREQQRVGHASKR
jgi:hypothetical protein